MVDPDSDYPGTARTLPSVAHYYGDIVRQFFLVAAAAMILGAPFYANNLGAEIPFEILGAIILVALAALANPHSKAMFYANAVAAGVGFLVYESWALMQYTESTWVQFILRELIAALFFMAFYFSMKTLRAFIFHQIGRHDEVGEFEDDEAQEDEIRNAKTLESVEKAEEAQGGTKTM